MSRIDRDMYVCIYHVNIYSRVYQICCMQIGTYVGMHYINVFVFITYIYMYSSLRDCQRVPGMSHINRDIYVCVYMCSSADDCQRVPYMSYRQAYIYIYIYIYIMYVFICQQILWGGYDQQAPQNDRSLLQNIGSFIGLFCKRDL